MSTSTPQYFVDVIAEGSVDSPRITSNTVAPLMTVNWEPVTDKCAITFSTQKYLVMDGTWVKAIGMDDKMPTLNLQLTADMAKRWAYDGAIDPVTGAALDQISVAGVMTIIKHAFEQAYDAEYARRFIPEDPA